MREISDNWEKLVDAVVRRERDLELCYLSDISSEAGSSFRSDQGSFSDDDDVVNFSEKQDKDVENAFKSRTSVIPDANQIEAEWIEQYVPGVYITLVAFRDGTRDLKRVRFSRGRFGEHQAERWWSENKEKVYEKYNLQKPVESSISGQAAPKSEGTLLSPYQDSENGFKSRTSVVPDASQIEAEWIDQYVPGVYITLVTLRDGTTDLKRVRFIRRRFREHQAENWWSENREKVYEKYNVRRSVESSVPGLAAQRSE